MFNEPLAFTVIVAWSMTSDKAVLIRGDVDITMKANREYASLGIFLIIATPSLSPQKKAKCPLKATWLLIQDMHYPTPPDEFCCLVLNKPYVRIWILF